MACWLGMDSRSQWNPLSAWWLDSYSLAYTVSSLLNQLFGKGKEPFWQQAYTNLARWIIELHRVFPERWVTLQQVYRCAIDPELFAAKIEEAEKLSDDLNTGTVFVLRSTYKAQLINLAEWNWVDAPEKKDVQVVYTRSVKAKLDKLKIPYRIVWEPGPGEETRERVEAVKRWFVHDWQTLDNKIKSSIVEGVSVFLAMFDMPDVAKVFCPAAPHIPDDPQAIILQAQLKRLKAEKDAAAAKAGAAKADAAKAGAKKPKAAEIKYTWGGAAKEAQKPKAAKKPEAAAKAGAAKADAAKAGAKKPKAAEIKYTWGGAAKEAQKPKAAKKPEAAAKAGAAKADAAKAGAKKPKAAEIKYTWGGAAKEAQKPKAAKKPEAAAKAAEPEPDDKTPDPEAESNQAATSIPPATAGTAPISQHLPPLFELIEQGKVLALNMPAGINPALARAVGVMLKNAWLQALLMRPAKMKANPGSYFRPAVFICDEYQAFASVGEDDPSGDEKSFALTRQCRCIPIVATQSISSLRAVLGSSEAWRSLLQTLRTRIFLSLSDDASAKIASELCGQVAKIKESYTISETSKRSEVSPLSGRAGGGGGSMGATKSFREQREVVFHPRDFALLSNCQAICLPYDGAQSLEPRRVYLKPHYLPVEHSYWRAKEAGQI